MRRSGCGAASALAASAPCGTRCSLSNLAERVTELSLPAYFFHGVYDYTVSYQLAKDYVESLKAPLKGFYTFTGPLTAQSWKSRKKPRESCARMCWQERTVSLTVPASEAAGSHRQRWGGVRRAAGKPVWALIIVLVSAPFGALAYPASSTTSRQVERCRSVSHPRPRLCQAPPVLDGLQLLGRPARPTPSCPDHPARGSPTIPALSSVT